MSCTTEIFAWDKDILTYTLVFLCQGLVLLQGRVFLGIMLQLCCNNTCAAIESNFINTTHRCFFAIDMYHRDLNRADSFLMCVILSENLQIQCCSSVRFHYQSWSQHHLRATSAVCRTSADS